MKDVIKIKKPNQVSNVKVSHEASSFYADLSKQWAIKLDKPIENGEYSSKYYAKISEQNADSANKSAKSTKETASNLKKFITNSLYFPELKINNEDVISNKLKLQKHSTFDKSKFTVVGSPTITEDGVASGFSKSNYLSTSYVPNQNYKTFSIKFKFNTGSTKTGAYIIGDKMGTANFLLAWSGNTTLALWLSTNNNRDIANGLKGKTILQFNKDYWINFTFDGTKYVLYISADGKTYTPDITITSSLKANIWQLYMGTVWGGSTNYIYDLSLFSITVDGKEVFNGNKTGIDNIKADDYEVAGSPVISDDGVAGGWSKENYITIPDLKLQNAKTWKIEGVVDIKSAQTEGVPCWLSTAQENGLMLPIWSDGTYAKFQLYLSSSASAWDIVNTESPNVLLSEGSTFKCELEFTGTQYVYTIYQVATGRKVAVLTADSSDKVYQSPTVLGIKRNTHPMASDNRINLNAFKIYVDGNLVYQPCLKIPYTQSKTGSKIVDGGYRERVQDVYEQFGTASYYTLDETNQNFTLPMGEIYGMLEQKADTEVIEKELSNKADISYVTGRTQHYVIERFLSDDGLSWYTLWSDNWLEQGGVLTGSGDYNRTVTFLKEFANANYTILKHSGNSSGGGVAARWLGFWDLTTTSAITGFINHSERWYACGYAKEEIE